MLSLYFIPKVTPDGSIINQYNLKNVGTKKYSCTACFNEYAARPYYTYMYIFEYDIKTWFVLFLDDSFWTVFRTGAASICVCDAAAEFCWTGSCTKSFLGTTGGSITCDFMLTSVCVLYGSRFCGKFLRDNEVTVRYFYQYMETYQNVTIVIQSLLKMLFADQGT